VVETVDDPAQIADAVAVRVGVGARVDLVEDAFLPPPIPVVGHASPVAVASSAFAATGGKAAAAARERTRRGGMERLAVAFDRTWH